MVGVILRRFYEENGISRILKVDLGFNRMWKESKDKVNSKYTRGKLAPEYISFIVGKWFIAVSKIHAR